MNIDEDKEPLALSIASGGALGTWQTSLSEDRDKSYTQWDHLRESRFRSRLDYQLTRFTVTAEDPGLVISQAHINLLWFSLYVIEAYMCLSRR